MADKVWSNQRTATNTRLTLEDLERALAGFEREFGDFVDHFKVHPDSANELHAVMAEARRVVQAGRCPEDPHPLLDFGKPRVRESRFVPPGLAVPYTRKGVMKRAIRLPSYKEESCDG